MDLKRFDHKIVLRIDRGEEVVSTLKQVCLDQKIKLGSITGLGAADKITIGLYNVEEKKYYSKEFVGDHEITNITGNITTMDGEVYLHIHITIGNHNSVAYGGHLNEAVISGTCEIFIDIIDGEIDRKKDDQTGLNIFKCN